MSSVSSIELERNPRNATGFKGVSKQSNGKFRVVSKESKFLGQGFATAEEAALYRAQHEKGGQLEPGEGDEKSAAGTVE